MLIKLWQGLLEGLRAHRKEDGSILLFRPHENALRMRTGADRLCMPAPSVEQFLEAVKLTVLANKRWVRMQDISCWMITCDASLVPDGSCALLQVPPTGKGSLYIRPQLIGSGAILGVAPAPQYTFIVFVCPVGHYFKVRYLLCFFSSYNWCCEELTRLLSGWFISNQLVNWGRIPPCCTWWNRWYKDYWELCFGNEQFFTSFLWFLSHFCFNTLEQG